MTNDGFRNIDGREGVRQVLEGHWQHFLDKAAAHFPVGMRASHLVSDAVDEVCEQVSIDPVAHRLLRDGSIGAIMQLAVQRLPGAAEVQLQHMQLSITGMIGNLAHANSQYLRVRDDVPQQVCLLMCAGKAVFDPERGPSFWGWLRAVAGNVAKQLLRKEKAIDHQHIEVDTPVIATNTPSPDAALDPPKELPSRDQLGERAVILLDDPVDRAIFRQRFLEGRTVADTARAVGLSEVAIYKRIQRLRTRLKDRGFFDEWSASH